MRKSLVLALVLVFAFASVSFAATASMTVDFEAKASNKEAGEKFFGDYQVAKTLDLGFSIKSEEENWDASFTLSDVLDEAKLGRHIVNVNEDAFKFTAWGGATSGSIGHLGDALAFVRLNGGYTTATKLRLTTNLGGVDAAVQVENNVVYLNGQMGFDQFTLGATVAHRTASSENYNDFAVYGGADLGIVNVNAAFASTGKADKDNTAMGIKASSDITEQLSVEATYVTSGKEWAADDDRFSLGATFTEGLFQAGASYTQNQDQKTSGYEVSVVYRGSEDNVAFDDLFEDDEYFNNVAPAFGLWYNVDGVAEGQKATSTITLKGTAPVVADQLWVLGSIEAKSNEDGITTDAPGSGAKAGSITTVALEGYAPYGKLTFIPSITSTSYSKVVAGAREGGYSTLDVALDVEYAVAADATLFFGIGQSTESGSGDFAGDYDPDRYTEFGVKVSF